jgi:hypothetical protein
MKARRLRPGPVMNNNDGVEITIPWPLLVVVAVVTLFVLGYAFSPRSAEARPMLLSPDVKAMEDYRRQASAWMEDMRVLDGEIAGVLRSDNSDLIGSTQKMQNALNHAVRLATEIDQAESPSVFIALRSAISNNALAYVDAARSAARWLSIPDSTSQEEAATALQTARNQYDALVTSKWLQ